MKVRRDIDADEDCEPVIVPRNDKSLVAVAPERVRRLREHLVGTLREMRTAKPWVHSVSPALPDPTGFPARVAQAACSLCKGWCCRNGDDNGEVDKAAERNKDTYRQRQSERYATRPLQLCLTRQCKIAASARLVRERDGQ